MRYCLRTETSDKFIKAIRYLESLGLTLGFNLASEKDNKYDDFELEYIFFIYKEKSMVFFDTNNMNWWGYGLYKDTPNYILLNSMYEFEETVLIERMLA